MNSEKKLQAELVLWFGQTYPDFKKLFFEVNNDTYSDNHRFSRKAMGMVAGVADMLLISPFTGRVLGIELKAKDSKHPSVKIQNQLNWGDELIKTGNSYIMSCDIEEIKDIISAFTWQTGHFKRLISQNKQWINSHVIPQIKSQQTVKF
jgi:hypothetical protein